jgi:KDO2-lipid IV(A) lauroyltransferase
VNDGAPNGGAAPPARRVPFSKRLRRELRVRALLLSLPLLRRLPLWSLGPVAALIGTGAYWIAAGERRLARAHLRQAFPDAPPAFHRRCARASFVSLVRSALEVLVVDRLQPRLAELVRLDDAGRELLRSAHAQGRGVLFASCHLGNWELLARRIVLEGYPCGTVAREAQDPRLTALLEESRARGGLQTLWRGRPGLSRQLLRLLRAGGFAGFLIDQDTAVQGQFVPFFGRLAHTPRVVGDLAVRTGAPVLFGCIHREGRGHRLVVRKIEVPPAGDREADSLAITAAATAAIEDEVRRRPEAWVWMHRRWRTQPPAGAVPIDRSPPGVKGEATEK